MKNRSTTQLLEDFNNMVGGRDKRNIPKDYLDSDMIADEIISRQSKQITKLTMALMFYRDNFFTKLYKKNGTIYKPSENLLDDCGNKAREALIDFEAEYKKSLDEMIADLVKKMTPEEKSNFVAFVNYQKGLPSPPPNTGSIVKKGI